jgi:cyclopropane fatty-acyl-phospholipid synthase-like methyltransferase
MNQGSGQNMDSSEELISLIESSKNMKPGADNYRAYVGPPNQYDFMGATQFSLLFGLGLRETNTVLDIGCGSLRAGKLLIQYLMPGRYFGLEPNSWLWKQALKLEIGQCVFDIKAPNISNSDDFDCSFFNTQFDFIVAQSIFSHTGTDLLERALERAAASSHAKTQILFTVLDESSVSSSKLLGPELSGWFYPECVEYREADILSLCMKLGLQAERLDWFHPRQSWYRAVLNTGSVLNSDQRAKLGVGKPLFFTS